MNIRKIDDNEKMKFIDLLLIADEQVSMIERYLGRGEMFALYDEDVKAVCVVTREDEDVFELKNIATYPQYQPWLPLWVQAEAPSGFRVRKRSRTARASPQVRESCSRRSPSGSPLSSPRTIRRATSRSVPSRRSPWNTSRGRSACSTGTVANR